MVGRPLPAVPAKVFRKASREIGRRLPDCITQAGKNPQSKMTIQRKFLVFAHLILALHPSKSIAIQF